MMDGAPGNKSLRCDLINGKICTRVCERDKEEVKVIDVERLAKDWIEKSRAVGDVIVIAMRRSVCGRYQPGQQVGMMADHFPLSAFFAKDIRGPDGDFLDLAVGIGVLSF